MIDFHNHILPNVDDGSKSLEMSIEMLREAQRQGITDVVSTTHFQHPKMKDIITDYDHLLNIKNKLDDALKENNIKVKIHLGAEVFFDFNLLELTSNKLVTFGNYKYMLIEFHPILFPKQYKNHLFELKLNGISPIIAHPERYRQVQKEIHLLESWIDAGCFIQIDNGSLLGHFGSKVRHCALNIIRNGLFHMIGSDSHNDKKRNFCLLETVDLLKKNNIQNVDSIIANPFCVINGNEPEKIELAQCLKKSKSFFSFFRK